MNHKTIKIDTLDPLNKYEFIFCNATCSVEEEIAVVDEKYEDLFAAFESVKTSLNNDIYNFQAEWSDELIMREAEIMEIKKKYEALSNDTKRGNCPC